MKRRRGGVSRWAKGWRTSERGASGRFVQAVQQAHTDLVDQCFCPDFKPTDVLGVHIVLLQQRLDGWYVRRRQPGREGVGE